MPGPDLGDVLPTLPIDDVVNGGFAYAKVYGQPQRRVVSAIPSAAYLYNIVIGQFGSRCLHANQTGWVVRTTRSAFEVTVCGISSRCSQPKMAEASIDGAVDFVSALRIVPNAHRSITRMADEVAFWDWFSSGNLPGQNVRSEEMFTVLRPAIAMQNGASPVPALAKLRVAVRYWTTLVRQTSQSLLKGLPIPTIPRTEAAPVIRPARSLKGQTATLAGTLHWHRSSLLRCPAPGLLTQMRGHLVGIIP